MCNASGAAGYEYQERFRNLSDDYFMPNMLGGLALGFIWQFIFQVVFTDILFGKEGFYI